MICTGTGGDVWEPQSEASVSQECSCFGITFGFTIGETDCICCGCIECGPCESLPNSVNYEVTTELGGTCSGTITKDCGGSIYEGACTIGGHGIQFTYDPTTCGYTFTCDADVEGDVAIAVGSCDPLDVSIIFTPSNTSCLEDLGLITIRIYE